MRSNKPGSALSVIVLFLIFGLTDSVPAGGKGGGKKPPPSPANPVVVFQDQGNIFVADADGSNQTAVYGNDIVNAVSWCSSDGTDVVFQAEIDGQPGIWRLQIVQVDGSNRTVQVGQPQLVASTPVFHSFSVVRCSPAPIGPDNKIKVVYVAEPANGAKYSNLYLANVDGSQAETPDLLLAGNETGTRLDLSSPSWSPAGDRIAFRSAPWDTADPYDVEVIELAWTIAGDPEWVGRKSLVVGVPFPDPGSPLQGGWEFFFPRWSNLSDLIAVGAAPPTLGGHQIWLIPADSPQNAVQVIYNQIESVNRFSPSWSPDDTQLVYQRSPRIGMCSPGSGNKRQNSALTVSNLNDTNGNIVPIDGCDEVAIVPLILGWKWPDWWRGAGQ